MCVEPQALSINAFVAVITLLKVYVLVEIAALDDRAALCANQSGLHLPAQRNTDMQSVSASAVVLVWRLIGAVEPVAY